MILFKTFLDRIIFEFSLINGIIIFTDITKDLTEMIIKLTECRGTTLLLNTEHIIRIEVQSGSTFITMAIKTDEINDWYEVKESPDEIYKQIQDN